MGYLYNPRCFSEKWTCPLSPGNTYHTYHLGIGLKISDKLDIDFRAVGSYAKVRRITCFETGYRGLMTHLVILLIWGYHRIFD